jgi:PilZ domain
LRRDGRPGRPSRAQLGRKRRKSKSTESTGHSPPSPRSRFPRTHALTSATPAADDHLRDSASKPRPPSPKERSKDSPDAQLSTSALTAADRRRHARYTVQVQIELHEEGSDIPMRFVTTDLSRGCYVQMMTQFPLGVRLQVTLWLDGYPIVIRGLVVTRHPQFGNGIMFMEFEDEAEQLLSRYLDAITTT